MTPKDRAKAYLLTSPSASNVQVAVGAKCSQRTVSYARSELVAEGKLDPAFGDRTRTKSASEVMASATEGTPFEVENSADLAKRVDEEKKRKKNPVDVDLEDDDDDIDFVRLKRILYRISTRDPDNRVRTQAIWTLTRIQQEVESRPLGPGAPMTRAGAIDRLVMLFKMVGPDIVLAAVNVWTGKVAHAEDQQAASAGGTEEAPQPEGHEGSQAQTS